MKSLLKRNYLLAALVALGLNSCFAGVDRVGRLAAAGGDLKGTIKLSTRASVFSIEFDEHLIELAKRSSATMEVTNLEDAPLHVMIVSRTDLGENATQHGWKALAPGESLIAYRGIAYSIGSAIREHGTPAKLGIVVKTDEPRLLADRPKFGATWSDSP